jgi:hypothetical protein
VETNSNTVDLREAPDSQSSKDKESSEPGDEDFETARHDTPKRHHLQEDEEGVGLDRANTQSYIDAQLMFEMSSAVQRANSENPVHAQRENQSRKSSAAIETPSPGSLFLHESEDHETSEFETGESVVEESEQSESQSEPQIPASVTRRSPKVFVPAAFRSPPAPESARPNQLLPAFTSSAPTPKKTHPAPKPSTHAQGAASVPARTSTNSASPPSSAEAAPSDDLVTRWRRAHARQGTAPELVKIAYRATSGDLPLAEEVLDALVAGESIPTDMRGVWTVGEDRAMAQGAERDLDRLLKKHGRESFEGRKEFLQLFDGEDKDLGEVESTSDIEEE